MTYYALYPEVKVGYQEKTDKNYLDRKYNAALIQLKCKITTLLVTILDSLKFHHQQVITPWRLPEFYNRFKGRTDLFEYAEVRFSS